MTGESSSSAFRVATTAMILVIAFPSVYLLINPEQLTYQTPESLWRVVNIVEGEPEASRNPEHLVPRTISLLRALEVLFACFLIGVIAWRSRLTEASRAVVLFAAAVTHAWSIVWHGDAVLLQIGMPVVLVAWIALGSILLSAAAFVYFSSCFPLPLTSLRAQVLVLHERTVRLIRETDSIGTRSRNRQRFRWPAPRSKADVALLALAGSILLVSSVLLQFGVRSADIGYAGLSALGLLAVVTLIHRPGGGWPRAVGALVFFGAFTSYHGHESMSFVVVQLLLLHTVCRRCGARGRLADWWIVFAVCSFFVFDLRLSIWLLDSVAPNVEKLIVWTVLSTMVLAFARAVVGAANLLSIGRHTWIRIWEGLNRPLLLSGVAAVALLVLAITLHVATDVRPTSGALAGVLLPSILLCAVLMVRGAANLRTGYRLSGETDRRKAVWIVLGINTAVALLLLPNIADFILPSSGAVEGVVDMLCRLGMEAALPLTMLCIAVAVFYGGALDPRLVLRKASLYALLPFFGVILFAGIENLVQDALASWFRIPDAAGPWVAGGGVALAIGPMRSLIASHTSDVIARMFPEAVQTANVTEDSVAVVAMDIADDYATTSEAVRAAVQRASVLQSAVNYAARRDSGKVAVVSRDLVLMEYPSVPAALSGIATIGREYRERCSRVGVQPVDLRVGVHFGPVLRDNSGAVFGPSVDIADGLRSTSPAGSVLISETAVAGLESRATVSFFGRCELPLSTEPSIDAFRVNTTDM